MNEPSFTARNQKDLERLSSGMLTGKKLSELSLGDQAALARLALLVNQSVKSYNSLVNLSELDSKD